MRVAVPKQSLKKLLRWSQRGLFACAVAMLGYSAFVVVDTRVFQERESRTLQRLLDDQADGDGRIFVPEQMDGLKSAILVNLKIVLPETRDGMTRPIAYRCLKHHQVNLGRKAEIVLILTVSWRRNLCCGKPVESKKKDREHERFRGLVLSVPGSFPLQEKPLSAFDDDSGAYRPRFSTTRRVKAPPKASSPRSAISGKGLAVVGSFGSAARAGAGAAMACATSAAGGGVTT